MLHTVLHAPYGQGDEIFSMMQRLSKMYRKQGLFALVAGVTSEVATLFVSFYTCRMESTEKCEAVISQFNGKFIKTPAGVPGKDVVRL